jgi:pyruvate-formate lyase
MMSDDFWEKVLDLMQAGIGFPAMSNDEIAIRSKTSLGISEADAYNYGIVGCVKNLRSR